MSLKSINQKGFAAMEAVLVIVVVAILAGTGYYVYQANKNTTDTQNAAHQAAESAVVNKASSSKSAVAAGAQAKKVYLGLLKAYDKNGSTNKNWASDYVTGKATAAQFTDSFAAAVKDGTAWPNGVFCTDKYTFEGFTVEKSALSGDTATVTLDQTVKGKKSSDYPSHIQATLKYQDKKWAVDSQTCVGLLQ